MLIRQHSGVDLVCQTKICCWLQETDGQHQLIRAKRQRRNDKTWCDRAHTKFLSSFCTNSALVLRRFLDIARYWSKIADVNPPTCILPSDVCEGIMFSGC